MTLISAPIQVSLGPDVDEGSYPLMLVWFRSPFTAAGEA